MQVKDLKCPSVTGCLGTRDHVIYDFDIDNNCSVALRPLTITAQSSDQPRSRKPSAISNYATITSSAVATIQIDSLAPLVKVETAMTQYRYRRLRARDQTWQDACYYCYYYYYGHLC